jgi:heat shock protein 1/8
MHILSRHAPPGARTGAPLPAARRRRVARAAAAPPRPAPGGGAGAADPATCVIGIDLGTTNSAVAVIEGGDPVVVPNQEGRLTTPSVVAFRPDGSVLVGEAARRAAGADPANTFYSVKRFIGRDLAQAAADAARVPYGVAADAGGAAVLECPARAAAGAGEGTLYPEEVSAYIVAKLAAAAEDYTGRRAARAVISVPAYFDDAARAATVTAGRLAGLDTVRLVREPVAAALAYGLSAEEDQTVLVFDLGGGTFDVSLLEVGGGVVEVLAAGGDARLGGDDWDAAIVDWLVEQHLKPAGADITDPRLRTAARAAAEAAKIKLSTEQAVTLRMPVAGGVEATLSRQTLEKLTAPLFRRARAPLDQACWQAGVDLGTAVRAADEARAKSGGAKSPQRRGAAAGPEIRPKRRLPVARVLLVGGATRMPAVRRFVRNMTGLEPDEFAADPDLAVALGAAAQAGVLEGSVSGLMVMDVWQASLMRAFAARLEKERGAEVLEEPRGEGEGEGGGEEEDWESVEIPDGA